MELSSDIQNEAMFTGKWMQLSLAEKHGNVASHLQFLKFIEVVGSETTKDRENRTDGRCALLQCPRVCLGGMAWQLAVPLNLMA